MRNGNDAEETADMATTTQSDAAPAAATRRKPFYKDMSVQVFGGMILGAAIGYFWPHSADSWPRSASCSSA